MNKRQNVIRRMATSVENVLLFYVAMWTGYIPFETAHTNFNGILNDIDENEAVKTQLTKGFTEEKNLKRRRMGKNVNKTSKKIRAWATSKGDVALAKSMDIGMSRLLYGKATKSVIFGELTITALGTMSASDKTAYDISAADEDELVKSVVEFKKALTLPRVIVVGKKTANENLERLFKELENLFKDELDNLMINYEGSDFFTKYFDARILVDQIRHTVIKGNVVNPTGVDLSKVKVKIIGKEKETGNEVIVFEEMTNKDGNFVKSALNPELSYDVEFSLPNFEDKRISDIDLTRGTIDTLEIVLVPKV